MEKSLLTRLADDPALLEAVRGVFLKQFDPPKNWAGMASQSSDELLGQVLRARITGIKAVEDACVEIHTYQTIKETPQEPMPAR